MKFAISGKGGVGKTTLAALLAQVFADEGKSRHDLGREEFVSRVMSWKDE